MDELSHQNICFVVDLLKTVSNSFNSFILSSVDKVTTGTYLFVFVNANFVFPVAEVIT